MAKQTEKDPKVPDTPPEPPNAVIVYRIKDEEGVTVEFAPLGNVETLEIPAILSIALKAAKARFGVD